MSQNPFKLSLREIVLHFLWDCWAQLGVSAHPQVTLKKPIDIDALLAFSLEQARFDARLFDEILDWVTINGDLINCNRLKYIFCTMIGGESLLLSAIAESIYLKTHFQNWKALIKNKDTNEVHYVFRLGTTKVLPVVRQPDTIFKKFGFLRDKWDITGNSQPFNPHNPLALHLRIRSIVGLGSRSDLLFYLATNESAYPAEIAKALQYTPRSIQLPLLDLARSGTITQFNIANRKMYQLKPVWKGLLQYAYDSHWVQWTSLFDFLTSLLRNENPDNQTTSGALFASVAKNNHYSQISDLLNISKSESTATDQYYRTLLIDIQNFLQKC
jgi:hypothetical protein